MRRYIFATVAIWIAGGPASAASLGGIVVSDSGEPVAGATFSYHGGAVCFSTPSGGLSCFPPKVYASTKTNGDGRFLTPDLPADTYEFCVQPVVANQLATCV